jgi:hypothetical protein
MLQLKQLPQDPLDPQFRPQLHKLGIALDAANDDPAMAPTFLQHLPPLGLLPALHARVQSLGAATFPRVQSQQGSSHADPSLATSVAAAQTAHGTVQCLTPERLEAFCRVLADILQSMFALLWAFHVQHRECTVPKDLLPAFMDQLLCNPAALGVLVQCGLSAQVQAAASAGSAAAVRAMAAVCDLFRYSAVVLHVEPGTSLDAASERVEEGLWAFLNLEANLPYLELLCLLPDQCEPRAVP